jgi:hypothetical protein
MLRVTHFNDTTVMAVIWKWFTTGIFLDYMAIAIKVLTFVSVDTRCIVSTIRSV